MSPTATVVAAAWHHGCASYRDRRPVRVFITAGRPWPTTATSVRACPLLSSDQIKRHQRAEIARVDGNSPAGFGRQLGRRADEHRDLVAGASAWRSTWLPRDPVEPRMMRRDISTLCGLYRYSPRPRSGDSVCSTHLKNLVLVPNVSAGLPRAKRRSPARANLLVRFGPSRQQAFIDLGGA
jgi:hypothetical protein